MDCITRVGLVTALGLGLFAGCSKSGTSNGAAASGGNAVQIDPANSPIAKAAFDFLDAVLKGDPQRASARLTPLAMQRIIAGGKPFSPPGMESASFRIGEVRAPSDDQAIVQCVLTDSSAGTPHSEEMCCLLRKVDNDWRVSGIAYGTAPDKPWTLSDFESGQNMAIPRQSMSANAAAPAPGNTPNNAVAPANVGAPSNFAAPANAVAPPTLGMPAVDQAGRPSPPYTAQEPFPTDRR